MSHTYSKTSASFNSSFAGPLPPSWEIDAALDPVLIGKAVPEGPGLAVAVLFGGVASSYQVLMMS